MEYDAVAEEIVLDKELNFLDKFMLEFVKLLDEKYVIVSGYVSILLGRSRASEDIDLLIPYLEKNHFIQLFNKFYENGFECLNTSDSEEAFDLWKDHAIRFARKGLPVPNMEFKMISDDIHKIAFSDRLRVKIKGEIIFISPLELQIAYKLSCSDKDFEDAKHLYEVFKDKLNKEQLAEYVEMLDVKDKWEFLKNE